MYQIVGGSTATSLRNGRGEFYYFCNGNGLERAHSFVFFFLLPSRLGKLKMFVDCCFQIAFSLGLPSVKLFIFSKATTWRGHCQI